MSATSDAVPESSVAVAAERPAARFGRREVRLGIFLAAALYCDWCWVRTFNVGVRGPKVEILSYPEAILFGSFSGLVAGFHDVLWTGVALNWLRARAGRRGEEPRAHVRWNLRWYGFFPLLLAVISAVIFLPTNYPLIYWSLGILLGFGMVNRETIHRYGNQPVRLLLLMPDSFMVMFFSLLALDMKVAWHHIPVFVCWIPMFAAAAWIGLGRKSVASLFRNAGIGAFRGLAARG